ncbi:MAG: SH3 domain-containing protein, partial [Planctomycetes bacterium]|nr:SH3 domain-containing protein [Planctomycetota bacterium]
MSGRIKNTGQRTEVYCGLIALVVVGVMVLGFGSALWAQQAPAEPPTAEAEATPPAPPAPPVFERVGQVTGTVVNVRGGPGIGYGALTKVLRGSRVTILSDREGWLKIVLPENDYSWVSAQFVEKGVGDVGTITGDAVNVRFDPATSGELLGQLNRGFQLRIVEE